VRLFILLRVFIESELFDLYVSTKRSNSYALNILTVSWCSFLASEETSEMK